MPGRKIIIAGATGLIGSELLAGLLADAGVSEVHSLGRRRPTAGHPKLTAHVVDFGALGNLPAADEVYLALGTTIKVAGSQAAFRAVDYSANLAVAKAALAAGAKKAGLVSAMGAAATSKVFYSRVKGELEEALALLPFEGLVIARPSLLSGDREALGQPARGGEKLGTVVSDALGWLVPRNYRPILAAKVAKALLSTVPTVRGKRVLLSGQMHDGMT